MGCEVYIDDDLYNDPWCQSCIDFYSDFMDEETDNVSFTADQVEVWFLAYKELYLLTILMPSWDFPTFDHFFTLSVRWSFFDRYLSKSTSGKQDEEYTKLMLDWQTVT